MTVRIRYFAYLRDASGLSSESCTLPAGATIEVLIGTLERRHPALGGRLQNLPCLVDGVRREPSWVLAEDQEVAWIPPVAGGSR